MRLRSILDMIGGELKNSSSVSYFNEIRFNPKSVKRGDLFILFKERENDLKEAIENGAYGVIFDFNLKIEKNLDIAYIRVKSSLISSLKLIRFLLLNRSYSFYLLNPIKFELAQKISLEKNIIFLNDSKIDNFHKIVSADSDTIFFTQDREFIEQVWPLYHKIDSTKKEQIEIVNKYLFETTFHYRNELYSRAKLPFIFVDDLINLISFLKNNQLNFSLKNLHFTSHFEPIFLDSNLYIKEFSKSNRVLIFENSEYLLKKEIEYLFKNTKWAKSYIFLPKKIKLDLEIAKDRVCYFKDNDELYSLLQNLTFNFILIFNADLKNLKSKLQKPKPQSLF